MQFFIFQTYVRHAISLSVRLKRMEDGRERSSPCSRFPCMAAAAALLSDLAWNRVSHALTRAPHAHGR